MKKKLRAVYALSAALLALLAGIIYLSRPVSSDDAQLDTDKVYAVTDHAVSSVGAIALTTSKASIGFLLKGENVELMQSDASGQLISDSSAEYSQSELRSFVYLVCHLTASRDLGQVTDPESYGYDEPKANITILLSDGGREEYMLLNETPQRQGYYFYSLQNRTVYIIDAATAAFFLRTQDDFISHSIFPTVTADNYQSVEEIRFTNADGSFTVINDGGDFYLSEPISQRVRAYSVYSSLIAPLSAIYADSCIASGAELSGYGFDAPDVAIQMTANGETYSALLLQDGDTLLMANPDAGDIYTVSSDILQLIPKGYMDLLDGSPYYYSFGDCASLRAKSSELELSFEFDGSGESISASCGGRTLDPDAVSALSGAVNGVEIAQPWQGGNIGAEVLSISFTLNSGSVENVTFLACSDPSAYVVTVNGKTNFTASAVSVMNLISVLEEYTEA